jgi:ubiquinone biosynthesis protein
MTHLLIYAAGWLLWPLVFSAIAGRFLGIQLGRVRAMASGLAGVAMGSLTSEAIATDARPAQSLISFLVFSVLGTLACVALLDFLERPATIGQLEQSIASPPHPLRAARRRAARARRYVSILRTVSRHRLVSLLAAQSRTDDPGAGERTGRQVRLALQEAGGLFVKLGQVLSTRASGVQVTSDLSLPQLLGYAGLTVATILGLRVLVGVSRDRVI